MSADLLRADEAMKHGFATFFLGDRPFALHIRLVREINRHLDVTPVHGAPAFVRGLVNLRGQVVTVVDLRRRLELGDTEIGRSSRLVVLKTDTELDEIGVTQLRSCADKVGLLIDRIGDVVLPQRADLEPPPPNAHAVAREFLRGVCKTEQDTIAVLDVQALLQLERDATERGAPGAPAH